MAQAAPAADGISFALLISVIAVETTLSLVTWAGFNAESRSQKDRDSDIRDAQAGYESALVLPAVARLIEEVLDVRRSDEEPILRTLDRTDTSETLDEVVQAAATSSSPREIESRLIKAWTVIAGATLVLQLAGPVLLLNAIANEDLVSDTAQIIAGVIMSGAAAVALGAAIAVRQLTRGLTRSIRDGKDAAHAA